MPVEILLTQDKVAVIDDCDADLDRDCTWNAFQIKNKWYATRRLRLNGKPKTEFLHRIIANRMVDYPLESDRVEFADGDTLNLTRGNLVLDIPKQPTFSAEDKDGAIEIFLNKNLVAIVDECDADLERDYLWRLYRNNSAWEVKCIIRHGGRCPEYATLHRMIGERIAGRPLTSVDQVRFWDGNRLNLRRSNLALRLPDKFEQPSPKTEKRKRHSSRHLLRSEVEQIEVLLHDGHSLTEIANFTGRAITTIFAIRRKINPMPDERVNALTQEIVKLTKDIETSDYFRGHPSMHRIDHHLQEIQRSLRIIHLTLKHNLKARKNGTPNPNSK